MTYSSGNKPAVAVLGGTGQEGKALAARWAGAGYPIIIGSRDAARAAAAAEEINARGGHQRATGADLMTAALQGTIVVLTAPHAAQLATLSQVKPALDGKILVDVTVPLVPPKVTRAQLPEGGSAVVQAQSLLGSSVKVVSAFQNISHELLSHPGRTIDCDVLVCGDDKDARGGGRARRGCGHAGLARGSPRQLGGGGSADLGPDLHEHPPQGARGGHPHHGPGQAGRGATAVADCTAGRAGGAAG